GVATELLGEEHLHRDLASGQSLLVEEHVGEPTGTEQLQRRVSGQVGRRGRGSTHHPVTTWIVQPPPRSITVPVRTGVGSPARSFTGGLPGATTCVPLRECRSVTTTVSPSTATRRWLREM